MTLRSLRIFVTLATYKNMTRTAEKLFLTQSSISQVISQIEEEYNVVLFDRMKNGLSLTNVGNDMLKYAQSILNLYDELEAVMLKDSTNPKIRIGASVTVGSTILKNIIEELIKANKNLDYFSFVDNSRVIEDKVLSNEVDIGIIDGPLSHPDLKYEFLTDDKMVLICSPEHRLAGAKSVKLSEVAKESLIVREENSYSRKQIVDAFKELKVEPNIVWSCSTADAVKEAVKQNLGISVLSKRTVQDDLDQGLLCAIDISDVNLARQFKLIYNKEKYFTNTMNQFVELARKYTK